MRSEGNAVEELRMAVAAAKKALSTLSPRQIPATILLLASLLSDRRLKLLGEVEDAELRSLLREAAELIKGVRLFRNEMQESRD
ncbi:MAG: hypothetical protein DRK00_07275 [Thermoprotei archaeon]|nr:MAG: hypothetical protein DRK00_07275 [Thermoprotei archaeon]